ncbi:MAG: hypothetical protein ACYDHP_02920 [Ferrimicrobium sp.]
MHALPTVVAIIPQKKLMWAKSRLAPKLCDSDRASLAQLGLSHVARALRPLYVVGLVDTPATETVVEPWVSAVHHQSSPDFNTALTECALWCRNLGARWCIIAPSDLIALADLGPYLDPAPTTPLITPDQHLDGTNLIRVPLDPTPHFRYGLHSFTAHLNIYGPTMEIVGNPTAIDVDTHNDIELIRELFPHALPKEFSIHEPT